MYTPIGVTDLINGSMFVLIGADSLIIKIIVCVKPFPL